MSKFTFTSESVSEGHPDKVCDYISDSILDACFAQDPQSRVACETLVKSDHVVLAGEITTNANFDYEQVVRQAVKEIGYTDRAEPFCDATLKVISLITKQSNEISQGVTATTSQSGDQGAGDQGIMFGFATNETPQYMPMAIWTAHRISERLAEVRRSGELPFLRPDGKTQVTLGYDGHTPVTVDSVVLSTQHDPDIDQTELRQLVQESVIDPVLRTTGLALPDVKYYVNPAGPFVIGGPKGDAGLTGRKIIIDTYGGASRHGGGAFSGKDPSKVDRSAAYAMRWVAKNAVAAGLADRLEVQVAYAIGKAQPVGLYVESFGTGKVDDATMIRAINDVFDLRPKAIITDLDLLRPIYAETAAYGHFGRELPNFTWERLDRVDALRRAAGL